MRMILAAAMALAAAPVAAQPIAQYERGNIAGKSINFNVYSISSGTVFEVRPASGAAFLVSMSTDGFASEATLLSVLAELETKAKDSTAVAISTTATAVLARLFQTLSADVSGSTVGARQVGSYTVTPGSGTWTVSAPATDAILTAHTPILQAISGQTLTLSTNTPTRAQAEAANGFLSTVAGSIVTLATEATLSAAKGVLDTIKTVLDAIKARADLLGTEATLATRASETTAVATSTAAAAAAASLASLDSDIDTTLSSRATESTLGQVLSAVLGTLKVTILGSVTVTPSSGTYVTQVTTGSITAFQDPRSTYNVTGIVYPYERQQALEGTYWIADGGLVTNGTTEAGLFYFCNLSTNTVRAFINKITFSNHSETQTSFRVYRNPSVTSSGTAVAIIPGDLSITSSSQMVAFKSPTATAPNFGTMVFPMTASGMSAPTVDWLNEGRVYPPGRCFLLTADSSANGSVVNFRMEWDER